ncbi:putative peptidase C26 family protein [Rhizobium phage RHph_I3_11]|nr:putative peptidase C26 family protein [Rhizobium phage RHph_I3_11]
MTSKGSVFVVGGDRMISSMFFERGYMIEKRQQEADIICFIGGWDINPQLYGQKVNPEAHVNVDESDDVRDIEAWKKSTHQQVKVGICRGGQFLNAMSGGKLYQHVSGHTQEHKVYDVIWGKELRVASSHHQMMIPSASGEILAYAEDLGSNFMTDKGLVEKPAQEAEVVWYQGTKSLCYQGHPEWNPTQGRDYFFDLLEMVRQ